MSEAQIKEIEINIEQAKEFIDDAKALDRLYANADFKKIVLEGYLEKEAIRLVHLKGSPATATPDKQADIVKEIDGVGTFLGYLRTVIQKGDWAQGAIEADLEAIDEIRAEME